ncbi:MAG: allantoate amidohydrolase, partial [Nocardioides sp.]|nr:allantoate amidohydrolase [Nocardioides sp.]
VQSVQEFFTERERFDGPLAATLSELLDHAPILETGAGHDAGTIAAAGIPSAMLFVRNPTGVSHSPREHAEEADCLEGVDALARVIHHLGA